MNIIKSLIIVALASLGLASIAMADPSPGAGSNPQSIQQTCSTSATKFPSVALGNFVNGFVVTAASTNSGIVYIGGSNVNTTSGTGGTGYPLSATGNTSVGYVANNTSNFYFICGNGTDIFWITGN